MQTERGGKRRVDKAQVLAFVEDFAALQAKHSSRRIGHSALGANFHEDFVDLSFFVAMRAARALRSCFFKTPSISSGSLLGVQPKHGTPNSEILRATCSSKVGTPLSESASRQMTRTPDSTNSRRRRMSWAWLPPSIKSV